MNISINNTEFQVIFNREELIEKALTRNTFLVALNANKFSINKPKFWENLQNSFNLFGYIDGIGANLRLGVRHKRIPGVELWLNILNHLKCNTKVLIIGGIPEVNNKAVDKLKSQFPTLKFFGIDGYVNIREIIDLANSVKPNYIFIALGSPKQEEIAITLKKSCKMDFSAMGIGGSLDVFTGRVSRTPLFFRKLGLEGLVRILLQPKKRIKNLNLIFKMFKTPINIVK